MAFHSELSSPLRYVSIHCLFYDHCIEVTNERRSEKSNIGDLPPIRK
jgi:hypothetical protein